MFSINFGILQEAQLSMEDVTRPTSIMRLPGEGKTVKAA